MVAKRRAIPIVIVYYCLQAGANIGDSMVEIYLGKRVLSQVASVAAGQNS